MRHIFVFAMATLTLLSACGDSGEALDATDAPDRGQEETRRPPSGDGGHDDVRDFSDDGGGTESMDAGTEDTSIPTTGIDATTHDDAENETPPRQPIRTEWPRGLKWVRENPMFISALTVQMGPPPGDFVNDYYDDFNANAIHLWATGLPDGLAGWLAESRADHRWVSWLRSDGTSAAGGELIGGMPPGSPGRIGYQVGDEPRSWHEYTEMAAGVNAVRAADPDALVYLNMSYLADEIDRMLQHQCNDLDVDVISYDRYSRGQSVYESLEKFRDWGLQCDKPYWRYLTAYEDAGESDWQSESDMRWDAFAGLVYGYTGHTWFIYQIGPSHNLVTALFTTTGDFASTRTPRFDIAAQINSEMANYGEVITQLTSTDVRYVSEIGGLAQPSGTQSWEPGAGDDPYITAITADGAAFQDVLIGFFEDNFGERYVMFQNVNHDGGDFPVSNDKDATIELSFDFSNAPSNLDKTKVEWLDPLSGTIGEKPLSPPGDDATLSVTLEAGNAFLFKYATGYPWARQ